MTWEAIQRAKRRRLSLYVVWLDLANSLGTKRLLGISFESHVSVKQKRLKFFKG